jgi:uncharacterized protein (DUF1697 family)
MMGTSDVRIALLRAINLGGGSSVAMTDLCALLTALGFTDVRTVLASGNLVFRATATVDDDELERSLETHFAKRLGLHTDVLVRTVPEWREIVARNPFPEEARRDPSHLVVVALRDAPTAARVAALQEGIKGPEVVRAVGRQTYVVYPAGIGRSKLTAAVLEKGLGTRGTGRNWNTVLKVAALAEAEG